METDLRTSDENSFVVIGDTEGGMPISMSATIESIGEDLSFADAVSRLRDMTRQNTELRHTIDQNNKMMRSQIQIMAEWKQGWEQDREEVKRHNEHAREVVTGLRADLARKDAKIQQLDGKIEELDAEKASQSLSVEQQDLLSLKHKIELLNKQVSTLTEEKNQLASAKDDICRELDQHTKIVGDLQASNQTLSEENKALQENNMKLTTEVKGLMDKLELLKVEKTELSEHNEKLMSYGLVPETNQTAADGIPCTKSQSECADKSDKIIDTTLTDLLQQLQTLRIENSDLKTASTAKNEQMEALHRKVHDGAERLMNAEHENRIALNREKEAHESHVAQLTAELARLRTSPRTSFEGAPPSLEDVKSLKSQVISLGNELASTNEKLQDVEGLYNKQKERNQLMEAKLHSHNDEMEQERNKSDDLISKLQESVRSLEAGLALERQEAHLHKSALADNRQKFAHLLQDYHESIQRLDAAKKQLGGDSRSFQQLCEENNHLVAQLVAADESMQLKAQELAKLKAEVGEVSILKAQCEIYKNDFDAERAAREKIHSEKEKMQEDIRQLNVVNTQLNDEMQNLSRTALQQMRQKHAQSGIFANGAPGRNTLQQAAPPTQPAREGEEVKQCPMCNKCFPDFDTLQLHTIDCLDD